RRVVVLLTPIAAPSRLIAGRATHAGILTFFVTFLAFPFYWMVITTFKTTGSPQHCEQSVPVQRPTNPASPQGPVRGYPISAMAREHRLRRSCRGGDHARARGAGGICARAHDRAVGADTGRGDLPHLSRAADDPVHPVLSHHRYAPPAGFTVVTGTGLSKLHGAVLHLVVDWLLPGDPDRSRGCRHD